VVESDSTLVKVRLERHRGVCSKTAPLTERLEQALENWVFSIAIH
jgi:hypothetical protein